MFAMTGYGFLAFLIVLVLIVPALRNMAINILQILVDLGLIPINGVLQLLGITTPHAWAVRTRRTILVALITLFLLEIVGLIGLGWGLKTQNKQMVIGFALALAAINLAVFTICDGIVGVFGRNRVTGIRRVKPPELVGNSVLIFLLLAMWEGGPGFEGFAGLWITVQYGVILAWHVAKMIFGTPTTFAPWVHWGHITFAAVFIVFVNAFPQDARAIASGKALHDTETGRADVATQIKAMGPEQMVAKKTKVFTKLTDAKGEVAGVSTVNSSTPGQIWYLDPGQWYRTLTPEADTFEFQGLRYSEIRLLDEDGDPKPEVWVIRSENGGEKLPPLSISETSWSESLWDGYIGRESMTPAHVYMSSVGATTYRFQSTRAGTATLTATLSSELPNTTSGSFSKTSDVTLMVNGTEIATTTVVPDDARGHTYEWPVTINAGQNEVTFQVKGGGKNKNGLAIYGPIRIDFR